LLPTVIAPPAAAVGASGLLPVLEELEEPQAERATAAAEATRAAAARVRVERETLKEVTVPIRLLLLSLESLVA
jgi:hypothetical protein